MKKTFAKYPFEPRVLMAIETLGFKKPTLVQEKVIPQFLQHLNLIVEAPTGTGKTAAYGFPLISQIDLLKRSTQALVLVPSRELALQVTAALRSYYEGDQLKVNAVYGGSTLKESIAAIRSSAHIIVAVPGRLKDIMAHSKLDFFWRDIKYLIMDEGDKLLESGFQKDFDQLRQNMRSRLQMGFFSATISEDAEAMMKERIKPVKVVRLSPREMLKNIKFGYVKIKKGKQAAYLAGLLEQRNISKALIFCSRREEIHAVTGFLRNYGKKAASYYGMLEQRERANILQRFKEGHIDYLVASDLAARGLDIEYLPAVVNISVPKEFEYYLHRVGRTGRAGRKGMVYNLIRSEIDLIYLKNHHEDIELPIRSYTVDPLAAKQQKATEEEKWTKFHLSRGKKDKVRKGDIVGFLTQQAGLEAHEIGTITIYDSYAIVDMPAKGFDQLAALDMTLKLKGKTVKVRKYSLDEEVKRAKAVKKLLQDRKKGKSV